jgi:hypothetical protein
MIKQARLARSDERIRTTQNFWRSRDFMVKSARYRKTKEGTFGVVFDRRGERLLPAPLADNKFGGLATNILGSGGMD